MLVKILLLLLFPFFAFANTDALHPKQMNWPFEGAFGVVDRQAAQRGFQVYKEVCSVCHGLKHLYYRNLKDIGFSDAEIKEIAKQHIVIDGPNDQGDMFERPALPSDHIVEPFKNEQAARAANNGALPVDLSLIVKAREDGPNHIFSILTGYQEPPTEFKLQTGLSYNPYFAGKQIAMPAPLSEGQVQYSDGTVASVDQMARDVVIFLQWAAEPEMEHRKSIGLKAMIFLTFFTVFFYLAKKRIWSRLK
jgi:ubiquinol-cytochrome c reductase cytochrome c1 subunit